MGVIQDILALWLVLAILSISNLLNLNYMRTGTMCNAQWVAINTHRPIREVKTLLKDRNLSQKGFSDFWKAFQQVRNYLK